MAIRMDALVGEVAIRMDAFGRWQLEWMHLGGGNKKACFGEVALNMDAFGKWQ
jgi:hypothetical protein